MLCRYVPGVLTVNVSGDVEPVCERGPVAAVFLTRREAAERLRVSFSTVRRLGAEGKITEVQVSKRAVRIDAASVEAHIGVSVRLLSSGTRDVVEPGQGARYAWGRQGFSGCAVAGRAGL